MAAQVREKYKGYEIGWNDDWYFVSLSIHGNARVVYQSNDIDSCYAWVDNATRQSMQCAIVSYSGY